MSTPTSGDFSCSQLLVIQAKAEQLFGDDVRRADVTPYSGAALAVLENQTATFTELQDPDKDREIKVTWVQSCDPTVSDLGDSCEIDGSEAGSFCQNYALNIFKETSFSINENVFRTSTLTREEVVAKEMAVRIKALDEYIARAVVARLELWAGVNALTSPYTVSGTQTTIPAAAMNASLMGYLALAMAVNKMQNMYMLSGSNLFIPNWNAEQEMGNADGKGNASKMQTFKKYFDLFNVDNVTAQQSTFLINPSAVAITNKVRFGTTPEEYKTSNVYQKRYSVNSTLPGIKYDVYYAAVCENDNTIFSWKLVWRGGIFLNPLGCSNNRTGILQFVCG